MYGKCVSISSARQLFDEMCVRNVVVWNSMILLYIHSKNMQNALRLFGAMDELPNASTFNTIITGLLEIEGKLFEALAFYRKMWEMSLKPNLITILALLRACVGIAALDLIKEIHGYSIRNDTDPHPHFRSGLVEAYGRCGCLDKAYLVFESMAEKDVVAWSSLISAYALHGMAKKALEIFEQIEMSNVKPDEITFLGVLKASYEVLKAMKIKATAKAWGALLGACRTYGEVELAEVAGWALFEIEPENLANYALLARIYASKEKYEEAEKVTREMKERGVKAAPGSSWVI
ncbi:pentatricopeptide repeat-containing At1g03510 [Olea europaea subsp. europaea]|uniref:Pentatricopeptide repeat-containing At1g03510 n=1 Tax=Olea europaea subsp. europaea TaxID=158383 RepID=A0A8S0UNC8_OLEEU|nr:pentatricopeptide repeat-containing At1g03510 [Olea europaea subsp. europaea]